MTLHQILVSVSATPRLSIGLPVYNGARYLSRSIESLLGQSFSNFELVISDNSSTDETGDICRGYEKADSRVRYFRQPKNIGLAPNHNFTVSQAVGELFKWAACDDLYAANLLAECISALDRHPDVVLAHSWTATVDPDDQFIEAEKYVLSTNSTSVAERFRSLLFDIGGDDDYAVIRTAALRRVAPKNSYHNADRTIVTELALYGRFYQVPDWLYFRRTHPAQSGGGARSMRERCATTDPRRANQWLHPAARLYGEYMLAYVNAVLRAPLSAAERQACLGVFVRYLSTRITGHTPDAYVTEERTIIPITIDVASIVAGLGSKHEI
jgi:glycosyltransferase involved in cell wall biosynthesis